MNTEHSSEHSGAMIKANKNLSVALEKTEARCSALETKIEKLNGYQKVFKHCSNLECKVMNNLGTLIYFLLDLFKMVHFREFPDSFQSMPKKCFRGASSYFFGSEI